MSARLSILVVDDNEDFCRNVSDILELKGYQVTMANDGFQALELVKQNGFTLVLMDIKMPVMDGVATFKRIKEIAPETPVIMVTAYAMEDLISEALREGAFGFLRKPLDFDQLFELIRNATRNGALIMVVDDDESLCANMRDVLSGKGYRVSLAYDGNSAIEQAQKNNFDVMLIDLKLPTLNGLETYLAIRQFRPNVVVIIITGYPQEMGSLARQAVQHSAYTCLEKPINMDDLVSLLERIKQQQEKGNLKKPRQSRGSV